MSAAVALLLVLALAVAVLDWVAVHARLRALEFVAKPLTIVTLIVAVAAMSTASRAAQLFFLGALAFSLIGDVFLMTKRDRLFVFGLGSFLAGHLAYIVGLWFLGVTLPWFLAGLVVVAIFVATIGLRVVNGVRHGASRELTVPVIAYMGVISLMVASAVSTQRPLAIIGASLFYASDALIAWNRFVDPKPWGEIAIIVTYHLGQIALALSLVS
ncbi:MAG: lysoplasmalogenase [Actinobacteria bacterium]|nr:lysoplasmalogenase [Actinomycetota bacterium]